VRCTESALQKGVKVTLNGQRLHCRNFKEYIEVMSVSQCLTVDAMARHCHHCACIGSTDGRCWLRTPQMYLKANTEEKMPVVHEVVNDRWEV
jgi:hypothetical protein